MIDMTRIRLLFAAALVVPLLAVGTATATTSTPCTRHDANPPTVDYISNGVVHLTASGGIGGCPKPGSVSGTVNAQWWNGAAWTTQGTAVYSASWGSLYRYARQASNIARADCIPGVWRTYVDGGDGFTPTSWQSATVTFPAHDGRCGEFGGGD